MIVAATLQRQKKRKTIEEKPAQVPEPSEFRCLVRATDGKKKISCSVSSFIFVFLCGYMLNYSVFSVCVLICKWEYLGSS